MFCLRNKSENERMPRRVFRRLYSISLFCLFLLGLLNLSHASFKDFMQNDVCFMQKPKVSTRVSLQVKAYKFLGERICKNYIHECISDYASKIASPFSRRALSWWKDSLAEFSHSRSQRSLFFIIISFVYGLLIFLTKASMKYSSLSSFFWI